jgi:hypothetical protein
MARIAKSDVYAALDRVASLMKQFDGGDGRISRADEQQSLSRFTATQIGQTEKQLADIFYKFVDHRDAKAYAKVTGADIDAAVAYAKQHLIANYDKNNNGLSKDEIAKMSKTAQLAVELAQELKAGDKDQVDWV